jgi:acyl transferase domain-containing protein
MSLPGDITGDIAIVGMAGIFPKAPDVATFWQNILDKVDAVTEAPPGWGADLVHDPTSSAGDRVYTDRGGFLDGLARFDPVDYGVLPRSIDGGDPEHFIALRVAREALADAGYLDRPFNREATAVILGRANYGSRGYGTLFQHTVVVDQTIRLLTTLHPEYSAAELAGIKQQLRASLPPFDHDTAPGLVPSVMCGRIANRLDLMGPAYAVDAACASSLIAVDLAIHELTSGKADMALAGGIHVSTHFPIQSVFCQLGALSRSGAVRPFSPDADGTLLGEGAGILVLKRRADAERDGDRVYALLKSVGVASDGRAVGILAPRVEGEELAMRRAYEQAGVAPRTVSLVEGHGTGTLVGDAVEIEALNRVFGPRDGDGPRCSLGSVKSMIGHPIPAAGVAGIIKAALALHHKVLPPTLHAGMDNPTLDPTHFCLNTETRPWIHAGPEPRRAGVSAFGFGGINAHAVLEEHPGGPSPPHLHRRLDAESLVVSAGDRSGLLARGGELRRTLADQPDLALADLAYTVNCPAPAGETGGVRLAIVATSIADLDGKLARALDRLADPACHHIEDPRGVYYTDAPLHGPGALAFLFPGLGAQYVNMLDDLCAHFPEVRAWFDLMDRPFRQRGHGYLPSQVIFPPPSGPEVADPGALWALDYGLAAVYTANQALAGLLDRLEIRPHAVLGHSAGDFSALSAAGVLPMDGDAEHVRRVLLLSEVYEQLLDEGRLPDGALLAISTADPEQVAALVERSDSALTVAMDNCPHQIVIGGCAEAAAAAADELLRTGAVCTRLPFACLPHTPHFAEFATRLRELHARRAGQVAFRAPQTALYSSVTAARHPEDPAAVRTLVDDQWSHPVRFRETIEAMYADGVRIFVEVGPRGSLTSFVDDILRGRPHLAVPADVEDRAGVTQLAHLVGLLAVHQVPMNLDHLYANRSPRRLCTDDGRAARPDVQGSSVAESVDRSVRLAVDLPMLTLDQPLRPVGKPDRPDRPTTAPAPEPAVSRVAHPSPHGPNAREQVMLSYLDTMDRFLDVQRHTLSARLTAGDGEVPATVLPKHGPRFPLLGSVVSLTEGRELIAVHRLDPEEALLLRDHTFGRDVSQTDESLLGLPVVPFTVSMEMLAEAAATLLPGRVVVGMKDVRGHQWIALDDGPVTLRLIARRDPTGDGHEVKVELRRLAAGDDVTTQAGTRVVEGTVTLAGAYPAPQAAAEFMLRAERSCPQDTTDLYQGRMFHGPRFQGVVSLDRRGANGIQATMAILPTNDLFAGTPDPAMVTDPQLLDAAGQLVGFWAAEHPDRDFAFFPFALEELHLFGPPPQTGTAVTGQARISPVGDQQLRSDIDLIGPDGHLLARLIGWASYRVGLPGPLSRLVGIPRDTTFAEPWTVLTERLAAPDAVACCRVDNVPLSLQHGGIWQRALAHLVLSRRERVTWSSLPGPDRARSEWLLGQVAAKDAVRAFLRSTSDVMLCPADVEIVEDPHGRLLAAGPWTQRVERMPVVSLSRCGSMVVAVAGHDGHCRSIGIDLERLDHAVEPHAVDPPELSPPEQGLIATLDEPLREEWALRLRCATAAAGKALGDPNSLVAADLDVPTGMVVVRTAAQPLTVQTIRDGDWIAALAIC